MMLTLREWSFAADEFSRYLDAALFRGLPLRGKHYASGVMLREARRCRCAGSAVSGREEREKTRSSAQASDADYQDVRENDDDIF